MPHGCGSSGGSLLTLVPCGNACGPCRCVLRRLRPVTFLVVPRPRTNGRSPMPGYAPQAAFARSREAFAQAEQWLGGLEAAGLDHAAVEDQLEARAREMLRLLLQGHLDLRAAREQRRERVTGPDASARTRAEA